MNAVSLFINREAKGSLPNIASPSSPDELDSPARIISQSHGGSVSSRSGPPNTATNFIYDKGNSGGDAEIKVVLRYGGSYQDLYNVSILSVELCKNVTARYQSNLKCLF